MISSQQALEIRSRNDALMAWVDSIRGKNGWASYRPEEKPAYVPDVTNEERSSLEVFDFVATPPDKYFLYIDEQKRTATTWTGETLGTVSFGREFRDNFGGKRVPVTVYAVNRVVYCGTYFRSAGNYARVRASTIQCPDRLDGKIQRLYSLSDAEIQQDWKSFSSRSKTYIEHYFPSLYKKCLEAIERCAAREDS